MTKIHPVPHIGLVMAGTGLAATIIDCYVIMQTTLLARDLDDTDRFATDMLRRHHAEALSRYRINSGSVTIYHFGYSETHQQMACYVYRSETGFASEVLLSGLGVKPAPSSVNPIVERVPDDFVRLIKHLADEDRARTIADQVGIGGEILYCHHTRHSTLLQTVHRFSDWEESYEKMCTHLSSG